jgi:hypothetical protein
VAIASYPDVSGPCPPLALRSDPANFHFCLIAQAIVFNRHCLTATLKQPNETLKIFVERCLAIDICKNWSILEFAGSAKELESALINVKAEAAFLLTPVEKSIGVT